MKICGVIPTFNRGQATRRAVQSMLDQSRQPDEIIVVDDASEQRFEMDHERVRVLYHSQNKGAAAARNTAIAASDADYFAFLDSDDFWLPRKLEKMVPRLENLNALSGLGSGFRYLDPVRGRDAQCYPPGAVQIGDFAKGCWFNPGSCMILRAADLDQVGPFNEKMRRLEDYEWFLRFAKLGGQVEIEPEILVTIQKGSRPTFAVINSAIAEVLPLLDDLTPQHQKFARAFLSLEEASASFFEGAYGRTVTGLLRSFANYPRLRLQPVQWSG